LRRVGSTSTIAPSTTADSRSSVTLFLDLVVLLVTLGLTVFDAVVLLAVVLTASFSSSSLSFGGLPLDLPEAVLEVDFSDSMEDDLGICAGPDKFIFSLLVLVGLMNEGRAVGFEGDICLVGELRDLAGVAVFLSGDTVFVDGSLTGDLNLVTRIGSDPLKLDVDKGSSLVAVDSFRPFGPILCCPISRNVLFHNRLGIRLILISILLLNAWETSLW
jgi:hypothetical protein